MLLDLYIEELLEKLAGAERTRAIQNLVRTRAVQNLAHAATEKAAPVRRALADRFNAAAGRSMRAEVAGHVQRTHLPAEPMAARALAENPPKPPLAQMLHNSRSAAGRALSPLAGGLAAADGRLSQGLHSAQSSIAGWATRTPAEQWESVKRNVVEGVQHNGSRWPHFSRPSTPAFVFGSKIIPKPETNLNTPRWWWGKLSR